MNKLFESKIIDYVKNRLSCSMHDLDHVFRVYELALNISKSYDVDSDVLEASVLLHDIARVSEDLDKSGNSDHAIIGAKEAGAFLKSIDFPYDKICKIEHCIESHRYRSLNKPETLEAKILFDADKLDSIGAIGISRACGWAGKHGCRIYYKPESLEEYIKINMHSKSNGRIKDKSLHSLQIEYELKLKNVEGMLYTDKAKAISENRIDFFKLFMERLENEVKGLV